MKIKVTKEQLKQLIKEEAIKYRKIMELQKRRAQVVQQLNELFEMDDMSMGTDIEEEGWLGDFGKKIAKGAGDVFLGSDEKWRGELEKYFSARPGRIQPQSEEDWQQAIQVAKNNNDARITKKDGNWVPIFRATGWAGDGFDRG